MEIIIGGDFYISDNHKDQKLFSTEVVNAFKNSDYRIVNLETPITDNDNKNRILKSGPHLQSEEETILPFLKELEIDAVTLANNHILDYGKKGIIDTFNKLSNNQIAYVGAGNNLQEAEKTLSIEKDGVRIAILNFCEKEWSIATPNSPGANPLDIIENINQIKKAKNNHDKVVCIIHGGHEHYHLPSPRMVKQYRFYADNGADAIVGHHTHCIGGYEVYNNVPIIYSLGNFIFTLNSSNDSWYIGTLVKLRITKEQDISFELYPTEQSKKYDSISIFDRHRSTQISKQIEKYNEVIANSNLLDNSWEEFCHKNKNQYIRTFNPLNIIQIRFIKKVIGKLKIFYLLLNKSHYAQMLNYLRCESHSDLTINIFENLINNKNENSNTSL